MLNLVHLFNHFNCYTLELCICKKSKQTNKQYPICSGPNGDNLLIYYIATSFIGIQTGLKKIAINKL